MCVQLSWLIVRNVHDAQKIWRAIAIVFMPPLSSAYAFLALAFSIGIGNTLVYLTISTVFATLIEVTSLLVFTRLSRKDVNIEDREARPVLFAIAIFSYLMGFVLLRYLEAPFIFSALMFAYFTNTILAAAITRYLTKVSIHTWGITGPSVAILYSIGVPAFVLTLIFGAFVGASRVLLRYHTREQVILSFLTSVPFTGFIVYILPVIVPTMLGS